jgi:hypothetical protein
VRKNNDASGANPIKAGGGNVVDHMVHQIFRLDLSQIASPRILRFHDYWKTLRSAERIVPVRADLNPTELRELLPNMIIVEIEQQPLRFRYRLVGTRVVESNKMDFTGLHLGSIGWEEEQQLVDACTDVAVGKQPIFGSYSWTTRTGTIGRCEFGLFPFSHDGQTPAQIAAIEDYDFRRDHSDARSRAPE